jgi:glycosyltransferase involved in cell wall biosynthesis
MTQSPADGGIHNDQVTDESTRPRVLLAAYACNPFQGSEPGVGWNRALSAAEEFDTWVLCAETPHGPDIRRYLAENGPIQGLRFITIQKHPLARLARRIPGLYYLSYRMWQWQAYRVAAELDREFRFDVVHQVTFCSYREPGFLWRLCHGSDGPVFVWGPLGGTQCFPAQMLRLVGIRGACRERFRSLLNRTYLRFAKRPRRVARAADVTLAANSSIKRDLDRLLGCDTRVLLETGIHLTPRTSVKAKGDHLRVLWCGAIEPWKALQLLLHSVAMVPQAVPFRVRIIGNGSQRKQCEQLAKDFGIDKHIEWVGQLSYQETLRQYEWANVFVFTSMRDTSGNVMLEALSAGLPVVAVDHQGAHDIITDRCGIKIPVESPDQCATDIAAALERLATDSDQRHRLSEGARQRAEMYSWERQSVQMKDIYRSALAAKKPYFSEVRPISNPVGRPPGSPAEPLRHRQIRNRK